MKKLLILAFGLLTFTTASAFTVVFSGGDLVTNGEFYTTDDWTATNSTLSIVSGGGAEIDITGSGGGIRQESTVPVVGKRYKITTRYKMGTFPSNMGISFGGTLGGSDITLPNSATYTTVVGYVTATNALDTLYILRTTASTGTFFIDNVSVQEVKESAKIDPALDPTNIPYSKGKIGEWTLAESDQQSDTRSLVNSSPGNSYIPSTQAYGQWEFDLFRSSSASSIPAVAFISPDTSYEISTPNDTYDLRLSDTGIVSLVQTGVKYLFRTDTGYISDDVWYRFKIERTGDGEFTAYIKGGAYSDYTLIDTTGGSGSNPVTNNDYTTSAYIVVDLHITDATRGFWKTDTGGFPVTDFMDSTGTTSVVGNLVVSDHNPNRNHGTWYGESYRGNYIRFDGVNDVVDVGDIGKTVKTVSFWIKPTTTSEDIIDLDGGTHTIEVSSGTITATGFSSPTIYVDGSVSSTLDTDWHHVAITTATGFTASDLNIGKETTYFDGTLANVRLFGKELSIVQVNQQLTQTKSVTKWVKIGDQMWMQDYLNVGTKIDDPGSTAIAAACSGNSGTVQTIGGIECYCTTETYASCQRGETGGTTLKYCYSNDEANCTANGALYEWQEAMDLPAECAYTDCSAQINTPHQGICPNGWHIPTDTEWKTLEGQLGMSTAQQDATGWRGTQEGDKLKTVDKCTGSRNCSTSGFSALLAGYRNVTGGFGSSGSSVYVWSSSQGSSTSAWRRTLRSGSSTIYRDSNNKTYGFSLRCLKD